MDTEFDKRKSHNKRHAGRSADKKAEKNQHVQEYTDKQRNPKAFTFKSAIKAHKQFIRTQNLQTKKHHIPVVDRTPLEPPPVLIAIVGGPQSGKSTLMRSLIKIYSKQRLTSIAGPVTVVSGKKRRVTFVEVNNDINCMIDVAKVADIVLLLIDVTHGIEMDIFEFLEICRAHGTPRILGVMNHLDLMKDNKSLKKRKKALKQRFQVELYPGAKIFYLSGLIRDEYMIHEVKNLSRFIAVSKFRPLDFRGSHPYVYVDRWEDLTNPEFIRQNPKCDRDLVLYGYVRGAALHSGQQVHIPGCGDHTVEDVQYLPDPCPLPDHNKKRSLNTEERLLYAPFSGVSGVVIDKDAVYIDLGGSQHGKYILEQQRKQKELLQKQSVSSGLTRSDSEESSAGEEDDVAEDEELKDTGAVQMMARLQEMQAPASVAARQIQVFAGSAPVTATLQQHHLPRYNNLGILDEEQATTLSHRRRRRAFIPENDDCGELRDTKDNDSMYESDDDEQSDGDEKKQSDSDDEEDDSDSDEDVDRVLPVHKNSSPAVDTAEPTRKKARMEASGDKAGDAFCKIQNVLRSLEDHDFVDSDEDSGADLSQDNVEAEMSTTGPQIGTVEDCSGRLSSEDPENNSDSECLQRAMFREAKDTYLKHQTNVRLLDELIYDHSVDINKLAESCLRGVKQSKMDSVTSQDAVNFGNDDEEEDDLFTPVQIQSSVFDEFDATKLEVPNLMAFRDVEVRQSIKDCYVTGVWKASEDAETLLRLDDKGDLNGGFEDVETGINYGYSGDAQLGNGEREGKDDEESPTKDGRVNERLSKRRREIEKKRKLKEMLEEEFGGKHQDHFDALKDELKQQAQLNKSEFETLTDDIRVLYEGFRPGMYVRMRFTRMAAEFVINFDPMYPVIVGGLLDNETKNVYNRVRVKVHRWYPKILKNRDPLILSVGWRRIQTMMHYGKREDDLKLRSLKYAHKHLHVEAMFWGPYTPVGTGFVAFQNVGKKVPNFRIAANGVVLEADKTTKLVKKLKLIGHPKKVVGKTVYITDMFHSEIEVASFIGAKLQTQSGIRGLLKVANGLKGDFRAKFEDVIKMSDVVILKTWAGVEVAKYCTHVRSLLLTPHEKMRWQGMKTVSEVKKEKGIKNEASQDSLYTEITKRRIFVPMPVKIPRALQEALPYRYKPKHEATLPPSERVVMVKDPHEEKVEKFITRYKELEAERLRAKKEQKTAKQKQFFARKLFQAQDEQRRKKAQKVAACRKYSIKHDGHM